MSAIVINVVIGLIVNECCDVSPWCARKLVRWSAQLRYAEPGRAAIRGEELAALIDERPGKLLKLFTAAGFTGSAILVACRRSLAQGQAPADEEPPQGLAVGNPLPALPGLVDIAGPLNLVASSSLSARLTARQEHALDGRTPDVQRLIDYLLSELRLMSTGEGVPARLLEKPGRPAGLLLYTTDYVLTSFVTSYGDAYTIAAVRPITDRDRGQLVRGALRLRPAKWSYYPELRCLPRRGDSHWSLINAE